MKNSSSTCDGMLFFANGAQYSSTEVDALPPGAAPRHMLVLGLGRGGTTACAQILSSLGFVCDTQGNPVLESKRLRAMARRADKDEFIEEFARWDDGPDRWFWKEPKLRSSEIRHAVLAAPESVGFLVIFRDILNVALRNHHVMNAEFFDSLERAARHNVWVAEFARVLKDRSLAIVSYEKLLLHTERTVRAMAKFLAVTDQAAIDAAIGSVAAESQQYQEAVAGGAGPALRPALAERQLLAEESPA